LVGANNVGKTSVLEGIEGALGVGRRTYAFDEGDISTGADPATGFAILLTYAPWQGGQFDDSEVALFGTHVDVVDGEHRLFVQIVGAVDADEGVFRTRLRFQKGDGQDDGWVSADERRALGVLLLHAAREARREFGDRGGLWSRIGTEASITSDVETQLRDLGASAGRSLVEGVLGQVTTDAVRSAVAELVSSVLYAAEPGAALDFSAFPDDLAQALRQAEMRLTTPGQPLARPITDHSIGTQSVAMFALFSAYAATVGERVVAIAVDEPEAHLHPHATRAVVRAISRIDRQVLISTHSTSVTDASDPRSIVLLRRRGDRAVASSVSAGTLAEDEVRLIQRYIGEVGSDFLFARAVVLAEGQSERLALPVFARLLDIDIDSLGISIVPVHGNHFDTFERLIGPGSLAIPYLLVCDRDAARRQVRKALRDGLLTDIDENDLDAAEQRMAAIGRFWWHVGDLEQVLFNAGAGQLYVDAIRELYGQYAIDHFLQSVELEGNIEFDDPAFLRRLLATRLVSKPLLAQRVAELFGERRLAVPPEIEVILRAVAELATVEARASAIAPENGPSGGT
jgi:hypothetical protein